MRYKLRSLLIDNIGVLMMSILCALLIWLQLRSKLSYYIHPRYFAFSTIMAAIGLIITLLGFLAIRQHANHKHHTRVSVIVIATIIVGGALVLSPASLSSKTALVRDGASSSKQTTNDPFTAYEQFGGDYSRLNVRDWSTLLSTIKSTDYFSDKQADITGFVYEGSDPSKDRFYLARFIVTCCAVDARPVGVPIALVNWDDTIDKDQWLSIKGNFESKTINGELTIVLVPREIRTIPEPKEPYVY